ncbi:CPSF A subunit region-domain-containing protein [Phlyctochytrium arcticum]|nr:CPSF A subunit region-domain-containing protein [Phlyctochytrium arcticum]
MPDPYYIVRERAGTGRVKHILTWAVSRSTSLPNGQSAELTRYLLLVQDDRFTVMIEMREGHELRGWKVIYTRYVFGRMGEVILDAVNHILPTSNRETLKEKDQWNASSELVGENLGAIQSMVSLSASGNLSFLRCLVGEDAGQLDDKTLRIVNAEFDGSDQVPDKLHETNVESYEWHQVSVDPSRKLVALGSYMGKIRIHERLHGSGTVEAYELGRSRTFLEFGPIWRLAFAPNEDTNGLARLCVLWTSNTSLTVTIYECADENQWSWTRRKPYVISEAIPTHFVSLNYTSRFFIVTDSELCWIDVLERCLDIRKQVFDDKFSFGSLITAAACLTTTEISASMDIVFLATGAGHIFRLELHRSAASRIRFSPKQIAEVLYPFDHLVAYEVPDRSEILVLFSDIYGRRTLQLSKQEPLPKLEEESIPTLITLASATLVDLPVASGSTIMLAGEGINDSFIMELNGDLKVDLIATLRQRMDGITGLWHAMSSRGMAVVVAFIHETKFLRLTDDELEDITDTIQNLVSNTETLFFAGTTTGLEVQVTRGAVHFGLADECALPLENAGNLIWSTGDGERIDLACSYNDTVAVAVFPSHTIKLIRLTHCDGAYVLQQLQEITLQSAPSVLYCHGSFGMERGINKEGDTESAANVGCLPIPIFTLIVGTYEPSIDVFRFDDIKGVSFTRNLGGEKIVAVPQSITTVCHSGEYMIITGLRDGRLVKMVWKRQPNQSWWENSPDSLLSLRVSESPVRICSGDSRATSSLLIFADRAWLYAVTRQIPSLSPISFTKILYATSFLDSESDAIRYIVVTKSGIHFISVDEDVSTLHERLIRLNEWRVPEKVLFDKETDKLIVACRGGKVPKSDSDLQHLYVVDPISGRSHFQDSLSANETVESLAAWYVKPWKRYICVGTAVSINRKHSTGRILVYNLKSNSNSIDESMAPRKRPYKMKLLGELQLNDPVTAIVEFCNSYLLVAAKNYVTQLKIDAHTRKLVVRTTIHFNSRIKSMSVEGKNIFLATDVDSVVMYTYDSEFKTFEFVASDMVRRSIVACLPKDDQSLVALDDHGCCVGYSLSNRSTEGRSLRALFFYNFGKPMAFLLASKRGGFYHMKHQNMASLPDVDPDHALKLIQNSSTGVTEFSFKCPSDEDDASRILGFSAITECGNVFEMMQISGDVHALLVALQVLMDKHPLTRAILGNSQSAHRYGLHGGFNCVDGDFILQFKALPFIAQHDLVAALNIMDVVPMGLQHSLSVDGILLLLEMCSSYSDCPVHV